MARPRKKCPICGADQLVSCLAAHAGSRACLDRLNYRRDGKHADPSGPAVLAAVRALNELLGTLPKENPA